MSVTCQQTPFTIARCCVGLAAWHANSTILDIMVFISVLCSGACHTVWTTSSNTFDKLCSKNKSDRVLFDGSSPTRLHSQLPCCHRNEVTLCHMCITYVDVCMISSLHEAVPPKYIRTHKPSNGEIISVTKPYSGAALTLSQEERENLIKSLLSINPKVWCTRYGWWARLWRPKTRLHGADSVLLKSFSFAQKQL